MAASDHLGPQFHEAPNGKRYRIEENAESYIPSVIATPEGAKHPVGMLSIYRQGFHTEGPEVASVTVTKPHRRRGVASAMFEYANQMHPGLQHSHALTEDGKAFAEGHMRKRNG